MEREEDFLVFVYLNLIDVEVYFLGRGNFVFGRKKNKSYLFSICVAFDCSVLFHCVVLFIILGIARERENSVREELWRDRQKKNKREKNNMTVYERSMSV